MSTVKIVAEYAKSSRSSCKGCSQAIPAKGLRLGIVNRHPRGFDTTHWHHLDCFPFRSQPIESAEEINGYALLEESDRDALKKLEDEGFRNSDKVAAFDFDGCLVNTSVKRIGADAWSLLYPTIPEKLQSLYNDGYKLVIFTNESNIERWKNKRQQAVDSKIGRLDNFIKLVNVPIQVFIACGLGKGSGQTDDPFRKPNPGMWKLLEEHFNSGIAIDMNQSFYVGDAAGRIKDHSDADIKFAQAIGLKFYVPEEYFAA
ncbi:Polynucleotide 3'-phosphatase ZDP [Acorus gramineus]|uniref:Polynucleotide 3'-phosphatase ZDP n=1 Tax=Acorus gramineus TaxID=55184 RepID=A0AAV9AYD3_ACOGR|nr:Polynucleotide 3'-phosphatase ZDP [Acorus gramineus]